MHGGADRHLSLGFLVCGEEQDSSEEYHMMLQASKTGEILVTEIIVFPVSVISSASGSFIVIKEEISTLSIGKPVLFGLNKYCMGIIFSKSKLTLHPTDPFTHPTPHRPPIPQRQEHPEWFLFLPVRVHKQVPHPSLIPHRWEPASCFPAFLGCVHEQQQRRRPSSGV